MKSGYKVRLKYPPPIECPKCGRKRDVFATLEGWLCWSCLPEEYLADEYGVKYPEPESTKKDRRDINEIRAKLLGKPLPRRLGRPKKDLQLSTVLLENRPQDNTKLER